MYFRGQFPDPTIFCMFTVPLPFQSIFAHFVVNQLSGYAEHPGGFGNIATGSRQGIIDHRQFLFLSLLPEILHSDSGAGHLNVWEAGCLNCFFS